MGRTTVFEKVQCPECQADVVQLSKNKIFECCKKKFLVVVRPDGYAIKEIAVYFCRSCKKYKVIVKKVY